MHLEAAYVKGPVRCPRGCRPIDSGQNRPHRASTRTISASPALLALQRRNWCHSEPVVWMPEEPAQSHRFAFESKMVKVDLQPYFLRTPFRNSAAFFRFPPINLMRVPYRVAPPHRATNFEDDRVSVNSQHLCCPLGGSESATPALQGTLPPAPARQAMPCVVHSFRRPFRQSQEEPAPDLVKRLIYRAPAAGPLRRKRPGASWRSSHALGVVCARRAAIDASGGAASVAPLGSEGGFHQGGDCKRIAAHGTPGACGSASLQPIRASAPFACFRPLCRRLSRAGALPVSRPLQRLVHGRLEGL